MGDNDIRAEAVERIARAFYEAEAADELATTGAKLPPWDRLDKSDAHRAIRDARLAVDAIADMLTEPSTIPDSALINPYAVVGDLGPMSRTSLPNLLYLTHALRGRIAVDAAAIVMMRPVYGDPRDPDGGRTSVMARWGDTTASRGYIQTCEVRETVEQIGGMLTALREGATFGPALLDPMKETDV